MIAARIREAASVFRRDRSEYPQPGVMPGLFFLKMKAAVCVAFGWEGGERWDVVPVQIGPLNVHSGPDGPSASWRELGVTDDWRDWHFYEYTNGV